MMRYKIYSLIVIALAIVWSGSSNLRLVQAQGPMLDGCPVLPEDNIWNTPVDTLPIDPNSTAYINTIGSSTTLHPDFGSGTWLGAPIGIPFVVVPLSQPMVTINISPYGSESDPGPYPVPTAAPIEGGSGSSGDRHVLVMRQGECKLYEMYRAFPNGNGSWNAESGAVYDLNSNALREEGWTSADAAGLPILPGLARYDEVAAGEIKHALRFTVPQTRRDYVWPGRHFASSSTDPNRPPMGQRFRLKADFVIDDSFSDQGKVLLQAMKKYGLILADNGSAWFISGAPDPGWNDSDLNNDFDRVSGSDFEAVDVTSLIVDIDSGQVQGFSMSVSPAVQVIEASEAATYTVQLTAAGSFSSAVTLSSDGSYPNLNLAFAPNSVTPTDNSILTLTDTHPGGLLLPGVWHTVAITATGGGFTKTATVQLLVGGSKTYLPVVLKP